MLVYRTFFSFHIGKIIYTVKNKTSITTKLNIFQRKILQREFYSLFVLLCFEFYLFIQISPTRILV